MSHESAFIGVLWILGSWVVYTSVHRMAALDNKEINNIAAAIVSSAWPAVAICQLLYFIYLYGHSVIHNQRERLH